MAACRWNNATGVIRLERLRAVLDNARKRPQVVWQTGYGSWGHSDNRAIAGESSVVGGSDFAK